MMLSSMHNTVKIGNRCTTADMVTDTNYLIKIEMVDGSSQLVQITKEQAVALGIEFSDVALDNVQNDDIDVENVSLAINSSNNGENRNPIDDKFVPKTRYNYKVIQPEDLNLRPNLPVPSLALPRGRPKKRTADDLIETKQEPPPKIIKPARTRSGRISRPPVHMEKIFQHIISEEPAPKESKEVKLAETKPIKINNLPPVKKTHPPSDPPQPKKKKRVIPAQYRCSTCRKAYLGRNRMAQHLKKHPDHGLNPQLSMDDCEAWGCLVETALKAKEGQKGDKFCKEFITLVKNARILAKYFFKPAKLGRADYHVDDFLSSILNLKVGDYRFNENELCKDVSIFSFLEFFDDNFTNNIITDEKVKVTDNILSLGDELNCHNKIEELKKPNVEMQLDHKANVDLHFGSEIMDMIKEASPKNNDNKQVGFNSIIEGKSKHDFNFFTEIYTSNKEGVKCANDIMNVIGENDPKTNDFNNLFHCHTIYDTNKIAEIKSNSEITTPVALEKNVEENKNDFSNLFDCPSFFKEDNFPGIIMNKENKNIEVEKVGTDKKEFDNLFDCHSFNNEDKSGGVKDPALMLIASEGGDKSNFSDLCFDKNLDIYLNEDKKKSVDAAPKIDFADTYEPSHVNKQGKEVDIFRNTIQNILNIGASDEHMNNLLSSTDHKEDTNKEVKEDVESSHIIMEGTEVKDLEFSMMEHHVATKDDIDLQKLHLLSADISDELILPDGGPVTGILDTSTNSDDIMNVDQFVNESFKKLTEADEVMPSLDLPNLDCFNFHSS